MTRIPELTLDEVNRAIDELDTTLSGKIKRVEQGTTLSGATGTFTADGIKVTVVNGLITTIGD